MRRLLFDLEGNGLLPDLTTIHCIAAVDIDTGDAGSWGPKQIPQALAYLAQADKLIAHFGIGYDFPALEKVCGFKVPEEKQVDTVVISRLKFPNIAELDARFSETRIKKGLPPMKEHTGKHTIAAWGVRLGLEKKHTDIEDWSTWTPEMQERCVGDVATALRLWKYLDPDNMSQRAIELEHRVARLCRKITEAGWPFDTEKAAALQVKLTQEKWELEKQLKAEFGCWVVNKGEWTPKRDNKKLGYAKGCAASKIEVVYFNPGSRQHIERCLRAKGWKPEEFTDSGQAKLSEEVIDSIAAEFPQAKDLTRYLMVDKRLGQLANGDNAWLRHVKDDGRIHAEYNPMGAITSRASHFNPNIAQVPALASTYGKECRELFYVPETWGEELGADMAGLEGRCFSHYLAKYDGGKYGEALLKSDPHWQVVLAIGFVAPGTERDKHNQLHTIVRESGAKRLFYAMLYGSGDEKAGRIILEACRQALKAGFPEVYKHFFGDDEAPAPKVLKKIGAKAKYDVIQGIEGFNELKATIKRLGYSGYLPGLDGRRLPIRSDHAALNTLLQSAGAILCKQWICDAYDALIADGLRWGEDFWFLGWIHDEVQVACRNGLGDRIGRIITDAARASGPKFAFRLDLDSEFKLGRSWADTH